MRSKKEIQNKIDELQKVIGHENYEISYLRIALEKDENELQRLLNKYEIEIMKYNYEIKEDKEIVKALSWVLSDN